MKQWIISTWFFSDPSTWKKLQKFSVFSEDEGTFFSKNLEFPTEQKFWLPASPTGHIPSPWTDWLSVACPPPTKVEPCSSFAFQALCAKAKRNWLLVKLSVKGIWSVTVKGKNYLNYNWWWLHTPWYFVMCHVCAASANTGWKGYMQSFFGLIPAINRVAAALAASQIWLRMSLWPVVG